MKPMTGAVGDQWHELQDQIMEETVRSRPSGLNRDPAFRLWHWGALELFFQAHLAGLFAIYREREALRVLDLGCGRGELTSLVARLFPHAEIIGIDANELSIQEARAASPPPNIRFQLGRFEDARGLGVFDVVLCSEVFEHVEDPDALLSVIHDALSPGGHVSFSTPSGWMWRRPGPLNAYRFLANPRHYWRHLLRPEQNWLAALPFHPATRPSVVKRKLHDAGMEVVSRSSSVFYFESDENLAFFYPFMRAWSRRNPIAAGRTFFYVLSLLEALLNLVPPLRIFETRVIMVARRLP